MPLENPTRVADLNVNWPLDSDPASVGAAHLRLIKRLVKQTFIGSFIDEAAAIAYLTDPENTVQTGMIFYVQSALWVLLPKATITSPFDVHDWFSVDGSFGAYRLTQRKTQGRISSQGSTAQLPISSPLKRRPAVRTLFSETGETFPVAAANALFPGDGPVHGDVCIRLGLGTPQISQVYIYTGTWNEVDQTFFNFAAAFGQFSAQVVSALSLDTDRVRTRRHEILGDTNLYVIDPDGFGPDSLIMWFGPKEDVVGWSGEVAYGSLTIANALRYETLEGESGGGGVPPEPDPDPIDPSTVTVLSGLGTLGSTYGSSTETFNSANAFSSVQVTMLNSGQYTITGTQSRSGTPASGAYLSETGAGAADEMQVRFSTADATTYISGVALDTWHNLTSSKGVSVFASVTASGLSNEVEENSATILIEVRKGAGTPETKSVTLTAYAESSPNEIP